MYPVVARSFVISIAFSPSLPITTGSSCSLPSSTSFAAPGGGADG